VTYHPYSHNPDNSYEAVGELRRTVAAFSPRIKIRQGENGCPSMRRRTKALRNYDWTETSQAKWALRRLLGDLGRDIESSYFAIMDMKYPDEMNAKGLLKSRQDQTVEYAKPAYYAVRNLASVFDNNLCRVKDFDYKAATEKSVSVFAYENIHTGFHAVTIWFDGEIPSDNLDKTGINFTFSGLLLNEPVYANLYDGVVYSIPRENFRSRGEKWYFEAIPVYDSPILITDKTNLKIDTSRISR
jgi:hypothetical protein